ncbi:hypothetical protein AWRI1631_130220, partial [Saccharomyces cerevisiae AWRI1631]
MQQRRQLHCLHLWIIPISHSWINNNNSSSNNYYSNR